MKGTRAKKAAEAAAAESGMEPTPPSEAREGAARPGPIVQANGKVQIPAKDFKDLIGKLRSSDLLGAAAADAFEAAAGLRPLASPQSKGAKELRSEVAEAREGGSPKKGGMNFDAGPVEEIPDLPPETGKKRASLSDQDAAAHDLESMDHHCAKDAEEPPELNLTPKQNKMRTDIEMWVMDEIPGVFGVDDSEELDEALQEDGQADQITFLIAEVDQDKQTELCKKWLSKGPATEDASAAFTAELLAKVRAIQELSPKKKKKKKKDA